MVFSLSSHHFFSSKGGKGYRSSESDGEERRGEEREGNILNISGLKVSLLFGLYVGADCTKF